jgi:uncharacterized protein YutE (UPF0331/DUF86 family)
MSDARWIEVDTDLESACRHFANAAELAHEGGFDAEGLAGYRAQMALLHSMQAAYASSEAAFRRILHILGEEPPSGERSHADLIRRISRPIETDSLARPAIVSPQVAQDLDEARRFRHRAVHDYDNFEPSLALPSIAAARRLAAMLKLDVASFRAIVDS